MNFVRLRNGKQFTKSKLIFAFYGNSVASCHSVLYNDYDLRKGASYEKLEFTCVADPAGIQRGIPSGRLCAAGGLAAEPV
jgi:hypothetical protein